MSWLSDPSANRYIQTYFKNFIDLSGNLTVRNGNINLINGSLNGSSITGLDLSVNILNAVTVNSTTVNTDTVNSDNITNTNVITTDSLIATNIFADNFNINDGIVASNTTGTAPASFVYNGNTVCHKDAIINAPSQTVIAGDLVRPNSIGLIPSGDNGLAINVLNSTNRSITFTPDGSFNLTSPAAIGSLSCGFALGNTIVSYESLTPYLNKGIRGAGTSANQPFITTVTGSYVANTPTFSLSMANLLIKSGYIDLSNNIVSLDPFPIGNYVNMVGLNNPTFVSGNVLTNQYAITSRNAITPTTEVTFNAVPLNSTTLISIVNWGGSNNFSFVTQKFGINPGTRVTNNSAFFNLTLSTAHTPPAITTVDLSGYVSGSTLKIESNPILPLNRRVVGLGTGVNGIPADTNSFIETTPGTPSSTYVVRNGSGLLTPTNTASSTATGFIKSAFGSSWLVSTVQQTNNDFVAQTGIPEATRLLNPTGFFSTQSKIMQLSQINGYTISATSAVAFTAIGMVSSATEIKLTTNPAVTTQLIENTTTPNQFVSNGTQVSSYSGANQLITSSGLTSQTAVSTTIKGYMRTTTLFEGRGLGNATARLNWFISGTNIGANKNYVSAASSASPFTLGASTNTATTPTGSALAGFTKFRNANSFFLVLDNPSPFKFNDYLISSTALPENTGLSDGLNDPVSSNDIIVIADYSTYTSSSVTVREPTILITGYKAYPVSINTYYVLETITLGATAYINSTKLDGVSPGFARDLAVRGTVTSNLYTTSSTLGSTTVTTGFVGAIFNGGASGYYFCCTDFSNLIQNFIVGTTIAPAGSVIYNSDLFDKGSQTISKLEFRTAPTASTPVVNSSLAISWYIRSNSVAVGGGLFDTEIYLRSLTTRITTLAANQFFINSVTATSFNNLSLNGQFITSFTQEATLNCFKATFRGKSNLVASGSKGGDLGIFQISTFVYRIDTLGLYVPAVNDFIRIVTRTNVNNIRAVTSLGSNLYDLTLEYTEGVLGSGFSYVITSPVTTTASLLQSTAITGHLSEYLVAYTPGSTYSYYPSNVNYSIFSPINMSFYAPTTYNTFTPQTYSVQTPFLYSFVQPISISDFNKTTISFYNTETIQFYEYYNVTLSPSACELVGDVCTQTLTNKTLTSPTLTSPTINTSLTLLGTLFNYVNWTAIADRTGTSGSALTIAIAGSGGQVPVASNAGDCRLKYYYSIIGKTMYLNYLYQATTGIAQPAGTYYYWYRLPAGFTYASWLVSAGTSPTFASGTRLGSARLNVSGNINYCSVYYLVTGTPAVTYLLITREQTLFDYHGSANYTYATANNCFTFEASVPLA